MAACPPFPPTSYWLIGLNEMARVKNILIIVNAAAATSAKIAVSGGSFELWRNHVGDGRAGFERFR
jgi:hypothetical protein